MKDLNDVCPKMEDDVKEENVLYLQPYEWRSAQRSLNKETGYKSIGDIESINEYGEKTQKVCIRVWCHTLHTPENPSKQVLVRIEDYLPPLTVELPIIVNGKLARWTQRAVEVWYDHVSRMLEGSGHSPIGYTPHLSKRLYYYKSNRQNPFVTLRFASEDARRHCVNLLSKPYFIKDLGRIWAKPRETQITTIIKYLTDHNQQYCQWIKLTNAVPLSEGSKISCLEHEYLIPHDSIDVIPTQDTQGWVTRPVVAAVDIECYSANHQKFPNKYHVEDEAYMTSVIIKRLGVPDSLKKILVTTRKTNPIEGAEVIHTENEAEGIRKVCELIKKYGVSLITGYNIFKFDFPYMNERLKTWQSRWGDISLLNDETTDLGLIEWSSSAYKQISIAYPAAEGRHPVDMYTLIRREHKLHNYKLETVSQHFLGRGKHDVSPQEMFEAYASNDPQRMSVVGKYCLEDSVLCIDLMEKLNTWIALTETSNVVSVGISDLYMRGQQIRVLNQVYTQAHKEGFVIDDRPKVAKEYKGAYVVKPIPGLYKDVIILDFASLYPSIIIAYNLCYTTLIPPESDLPKEKYNLFEWVEVNEETGEKVVHKHRFVKKEVYHGLLPRICENLLKARKAVRRQISDDNDPVVNNILDARQAALKVSANSIYGSLGATESGKLPLVEGAEVVTAMGRILITKAGEFVEKNYGGRIVYGDTDSIMVDMGLDRPEQRRKVCETLDVKETEDRGRLCHQVGKALEKNISGIFPEPLKLEYEGSAETMLCLKKKMYLKRMYYFDSDSGKFLVDKKIKMKGVMPARRDNCKWARDVYTAVAEIIFNGGSLDEIKKAIETYVSDLYLDKVPPEDLVITREMGKAYKAESNYFMKTFAEEMFRIGHPIEGGERIGYVIVVDKDPIRNRKTGFKMRLFKEVFLKRDEPIDKEYYVQRIAGKAVDRLVYTTFMGRKDVEIPELMMEFGEEKCVVCLNNEPQYVLRPCYHKCMCRECCTKVVNSDEPRCPMCRRKIQRVVLSVERENYIDNKFKFMKAMGRE